MEIKTIRRHCVICGATTETPVDILAAMAEAPQFIAEAVRANTAGSSAGWSPSEVAAHLADIEVAFGWRTRHILASDRPSLQPFDQEDWAVALGYGQRDTGIALDAFGASRAANVELLRGLDEAGWNRGFRHPEFGEHTLRDLVQHIADHDLAHIGQIRGEA